MPVYTLERSQVIRQPLAESWEFFSNPANLAQITPPSLGFKVETQVPPEIYPGLMICHTVRPLFGIPTTWLTEITQVRAPHYFVDEQRVGPYAVWHHEHFFEAVNEQETRVRDLVTYCPPLGPLGAAINRWLVRPQLERIFDYRTEVLEKIVRGS